MTKERRCGRSPTQKTLTIIRGGGGSRALDPPTRLKTHPPRPPPPHCKIALINEACSPTRKRQTGHIENQLGGIIRLGTPRHATPIPQTRHIVCTITFLINHGGFFLPHAVSPAGLLHPTSTTHKHCFSHNHNLPLATRVSKCMAFRATVSLDTGIARTGMLPNTAEGHHVHQKPHGRWQKYAHTGRYQDAAVHGVHAQHMQTNQ